MRQITRERIRYAVADFGTVAVGWFVFNIIRYFTIPSGMAWGSLTSFLLDKMVIIGQIVVPVAVVLLYAVAGSYNRSNTLYKSRLDEVVTSFVVSVAGMFGIFFIMLIDDSVPERLTNYELMLALLLCLFVPTAVVRLVITTRNARRIRQGRYAIRALVVGASPKNSAKLKRIIDSEAVSGLRIVACLDVDNKSQADTLLGLPVVRDDDYAALCDSLGVHALIMMPSQFGIGRSSEIMGKLYALDKPLFVTPDLMSMMTSRHRVSQVASEPLVDITNANISPLAVNLKRLGDMVLASAALLVLVPVYAAVALAVRLDSRGPVFYRQERIGYHKKPFRIIKFRTMCTDAEADGPALSRDNDPRVTRVGAFLRKYRLDELPQFWNVVKGEMSLVGPRPERSYYIEKIARKVPSYSLIHQVRPGITSWGMVKYGYAADVDQMIERLPYDLLYREIVSFGVDLKIMFHTVSTVLRGRGK